MAIKLYDPLSIATNTIDGYQFINKFGRNTDIDTSTTPEVVWSHGGMYIPPSSAQTHTVTSTSTDDIGTLVYQGNVTSFSVLSNGDIEVVDTGATFITDSVAIGDTIIDNTRVDHSIVVSVDSETQITVQPLHDNKESVPNMEFKSLLVQDDFDIITPASNGATVLHIFGLDTNGDEVEEFLILSGTTGIETAHQYLRINRSHIDAAGSGTTNIGDISVISNNESNTTSYIEAGDGQTLQMFYTVPNNKTAFITNLTFGSHRIGPVANTMASATLRSNKFIPQGTVSTIEDTIATVLRGTTSTQKIYNPFKVFKQRTDVWLQVDFASDNDLNISASMDIITIDNDKM